MLEGRDHIKDLFSEKLNGFESEVRPDVWSKISSQIGTTAATTTGTTILTKIIIATTVAASIGGGIFYLVNSKGIQNRSEKSKPEKEQVEQVSKSELEKQESDSENTELVNSKTNPFYHYNTEEKIGSTTDLPNENEDQFNQINKNFIDSEDITQNDNIDKKDVVLKDKEVIYTPEDVETPISVKDPVIEEFKHNEEVHADYILELPNVFTPNGDGTNDVLTITTKDLSDLTVVVLDKSNKIVYSTQNEDFRWDGTMRNGDTVPSGNYVYYVTAKDANGKLVSKYSLLTITR